MSQSFYGIERADALPWRRQAMKRYQSHKERGVVAVERTFQGNNSVTTRYKTPWYCDGVPVEAYAVRYKNGEKEGTTEVSFHATLDGMDFDLTGGLERGSFVLLHPDCPDDLPFNRCRDIILDVNEATSKLFSVMSYQDYINGSPNTPETVLQGEYIAKYLPWCAHELGCRSEYFVGAVMTPEDVAKMYDTVPGGYDPPDFGPAYDRDPEDY